MQECIQVKDLTHVMYVRNHIHNILDYINIIKHIERMKSKNTNIPFTQSNFVDCGETIKEEDIKEEIKDVVSVEDPLTIHHEIENSNICENIYKEINEVVTNSVENNAHGVNNVIDDMDEEVNDAIDDNGDNVDYIDENVVGVIDNDVMDNIGENVNDIDENVVGEGNINYQELENLSVAEALAFFSS